MPTVTMSMEEYLRLVEGSNVTPESPSVEEVVSKAKPRRKGKKDPKMARALKMAHSKAKKKNGDFRVGYDQSKMMSLAHKIRRKMK